VPADDLDAAIRAFQAARDAVPAAQDRARAVVADARTKVEQTRARLAAAIVTAYQHGARVTDLAARTGYNRESIRRILRAAGIEASD
jgi:hypothetical protein